MTRRYTDEEVRAILRRATDPGVRALPPAPGEGLTLRELQEVALEAGIDPEEVRIAGLASLPPSPASAAGRLVGGPAVRTHQVVVPGALPPARLASLTGALERVLERELRMDVDDGAVVWSEDHGQGRTRLALRAVDGGTEIDVEADRKGWLTLLGVGAGVAGLGVSPLLATLLGGLPAWPLLTAAAALGLAVAGMRAVWAPYSRRLHGRLERAVAEVVAEAEVEEGDPAGSD